MYVNKIDELFDNILNKLDEYLIKHKTFQAFSKDTNFVKYQNQILETLKDFIDKNVSKKYILDLLKNESYYEYFFGIICVVVYMSLSLLLCLFARVCGHKSIPWANAVYVRNY